MTVVIVGSGKLAQEVLHDLKGGAIDRVVPWAAFDASATQPGYVVHAGSGRELPQVFDYCGREGVPLIDLSTQSVFDPGHSLFPLVVCPNTNLLILKFMAMISRFGRGFQNYPRSLLESHQSTKTTAPGTALALAQSLGMDAAEIESVRSPAEQVSTLGIPRQYLTRHAYHKIVIGDEKVSLTFESQVFGPAPYAAGLAEILDALSARKLENRIYNVLELIEP